MSVRRSPDQILHHYKVEKELATKLRNASAMERRTLYNEVYDEMFRRVPEHPQLTRKGTDDASRRVAGAMAMIQPLLRPDDTFLEVGAGDCAVSFAVARHVRKVIAVDVSEVISAAASRPANFELVISDGTNIPVPPGSVDLAYSNQLMEHLHPDDAVAQLAQIAAALRPGGSYLCVTPHRYAGPHDVSVFYDEVATGFHLKEYSYAELAALFRAAGLTAIEAMVGFKGHWRRVPLAPLLAVEAGLGPVPHKVRREMCRRLPLRLLMGFQLLATKAA